MGLSDRGLDVGAFVHDDVPVYPPEAGALESKKDAEADLFAAQQAAGLGAPGEVRPGLTD